MRLRSISLNAIRSFEAAARLCSIKKASDELFVTPQAVSIQVKQLENQLSTVLFTRQNKQLKLTETGSVLFEYICQAFCNIEQGMKSIQDVENRKILKVTVSPFFATHYLLPQLDDFEQQNPDIQLKINATISADSEQDSPVISILWGFGEWQYEHQKLLIQDEKRLVCSPKLIKSKTLNKPSDLKKFRLLCTPLSTSLWERLIKLLGVNTNINSQAICLNSHATMLEAVLAGLGVALINQEEANIAIKTGALIMPLGDWSISDINPALTPGYWILSDQYKENNNVQAFIDWVSDLPNIT